MAFEFIKTTAALFSFTFLFGLLKERYITQWNVRPNFYIGLKYGIIASMAMLMPLIVSEGILYDIRVPLICLAGIFGGITGATTAALAPMLYRIYLGGAGLPAGLLSSLSALLLGVLLHHLFKTKVKRSLYWYELALAGTACGAMTLGWVYLLPTHIQLAVFSELSLLIIFVYTLSALAFGLFENKNDDFIYSQQRIAENQRLIATAENVGRFGLGSFDIQSRELIASMSLKNLLGLTKDILTPISFRTLKQITSADKNPSFLQFIDSLIHQLDPEPVELKIPSSKSQHDDKTFWVHFLGWENSNNPAGAILLFQDITERNLLFEQMSHAARLATLGEAAASISHEVSNPLTSARLTLEVLKKQIIHPEKYAANDSIRLINQLDSRLASITALTRSISLFSRAEPTTRESLSLHEELYRAVELFREINGNQAPEIILDCVADRDTVAARNLHIQQIFINLFNNSQFALKNTSKPYLKVATYNNDNNLIIEVEDNGPGIPPDIQTKIFNPFFTTKEPGSGTGLGLSVVGSIVEDMSGTIDFKSTPETGTTFRISLPLYQPAT